MKFFTMLLFTLISAMSCNIINCYANEEPSMYNIGKRSKYNIAKRSKRITVNRKFVVVVLSYNNEKFVEKNIQSILEQTYPYYRVLYVDDASSDRTYDCVSDLIHRSSKSDNFIVIRNEINQKQLYNFYNVIHSYCQDDEIVVNLDGDDFFAHPKVLEHLNAYYQSPDVWMTWGSYVHWSNRELGLAAKPTEKSMLINGTVKQGGFRYSHPRTCYAKLFKNIKKEDLIINGKFGQSAPDLFLMFPMLEMSRLHAFFIPEVLYIYNDMNSLSEVHVNPSEAFMEVVNFVYSLSPYPQINERNW